MAVFKPLDHGPARGRFMVRLPFNGLYDKGECMTRTLRLFVVGLLVLAAVPVLAQDRQGGRRGGGFGRGGAGGGMGLRSWWRSSQSKRSWSW